MTESRFYEELLQLPDLRILKVEKEGKKIILQAESLSTTSKCPQCLGDCHEVHQYTKREVRDLDISGKEVWLHLRVKQYVCPICNRYFSERFDWVAPNKSYTKRQSKWIFELCAKQPFTEAGALANMNHKTVERLYHEQGESRLDLKKRYAQVKHLGIDEISHRKGKQDYCCVLTDLERGVLLDILPDRKKETLLKHFQSLGEEFCNQIEVVSCDIWKTYINAAKECFPKTKIVLDRFHVVKALNEVLDKIRKGLRKEHKEEAWFKKLKWKLFKQPQACQKEDLELLENAFEKSWELEEVYQLRNTFHAILDISKDKVDCIEQLNSWQEHAATLGNEHMNTFLKTLDKWKENIAEFVENRITNAATEGLNNLIRYFKRISFGLPNFKNMRLRILLAHA